jgi:hypothetical protein
VLLDLGAVAPEAGLPEQLGVDVRREDLENRRASSFSIASRTRIAIE